MPASNIQLNALGPEDFYLTANPQITFFKSVFRRHTNFYISREQIEFNSENPYFKYPSNSSQEQKFLVKLRRNGDLLGEMFLEVNIKGKSTTATKVADVKKSLRLSNSLTVLAKAPDLSFLVAKFIVIN